MTDVQAKLIDLLGDFSNAMLVTQKPDGGLDARPMAIARVDDDGDLWFATDRNSGKVAEIKHDDDVVVTMQQNNKFVSLSGKCKLVDDRGKVAELWQEPWRVWFPGGKDDPSILLLHVDAVGGEYWDNSGVEGIQYLLKAGLAYVQGKQAETDSQINASTKL